jgi:hypothetical protein
MFFASGPTASQAANGSRRATMAEGLIVEQLFLFGENKSLVATLAGLFIYVPKGKVLRVVGHGMFFPLLTGVPRNGPA